MRKLTLSVTVVLLAFPAIIFALAAIIQQHL